MSVISSVAQSHERTAAMTTGDNVDWLIGAMQFKRRTGYLHLARVADRLSLKPQAKSVSLGIGLPVEAMAASADLV